MDKRERHHDYDKNNNSKREVSIGCGCLTDIIAIFLLVILLDMLGCSWCSGVTDKLGNLIHGNPTHIEEQQNVQK